MEAAKGKNVQWVYDAVSENGSTVLLARVLSKVSPSGKGKVTHVLILGGDEQKQIPQGIEAEWTGVNTAYGKDQECNCTLLRTSALFHAEGYLL